MLRDATDSPAGAGEPHAGAAIRDVLATLNEGRATLETMNAAHACLLRCLDAWDGAAANGRGAEVRASLEAVRDSLCADGVALTRTEVVTRIADAQAALRAALARAEGA